MVQYIPIILICLSANPTDTCVPGNKDVTVIIGETSSTPQGCFIEGFTRVAGLAIAPRLGDGSYVRIKCVPKTHID